MPALLFGAKIWRTYKMLLQFTKMEGCGNDYIYINGFTQHLPEDEKPRIVRELSREHFGIGGDGVIFINPSALADFEMEMYNKDGSRGKMCGNGIRCVGKYVYDHGMTGGRSNFTVESFGSVKKLELTCRDGKAIAARVNMGKPVLEPASIPVRLPDVQDGTTAVVAEPIETAGRLWRMTCVSMGNPHAVVFLDKEEADLLKACGRVDENGQEIPDGDLRNLDIEGIGPAFEHHPCFPERTNTEFVQVVDRQHVNMRVWERGSGETLACGTGCCATAVACALGGKTDRELDVRLLGGTLHIAWDEKTDEIYMTGPAKTVFDGTILVGENAT